MPETLPLRAAASAEPFCARTSAAKRIARPEICEDEARRRWSAAAPVSEKTD
jgi:hypothetical protein